MTVSSELIGEKAPSAVGSRLAPPVPGRTLILRPRLLAALQGRFRMRLTVVIGGPGFGKSSLLSQAVAENDLAPRGSDVWLTCREGDNAASSLAHAVGEAFRLPGPSSWDPDVVIDRVAARIWARSPEQVALILDDAHLVVADSPGATLLSALLDRLPRNAHLVLAGRDTLPVGTARLAAQGQLTQLSEADLAFTAEEIVEFEALRGVSPGPLADSGGWPALAELSASAGGERMLDFLWEELLAALPVERRRDLAALSLFAPLDDDIAAALAGHPVDLTATLADLPLVTGRPGTARALHPLWQPALARLLSDAEAAAARRRAAAVLRGRGKMDAAVRLLMAAAGWDEIRQIVCETAVYTHPLVAPDVLEHWYRGLPEDERGSPEAALLQALAMRAHDLIRAIPLFSLAANRFRAAGNVLGEAAALTHIAHIGWWLNDIDAITTTVTRIGELADAFPWLVGLAMMGRILAADASGEFAAALDVLGHLVGAVVPPTMAYGVEWLWAWELLLTGLPERATRHAGAAVRDAPGTFLAPALNVDVLSLWQSGLIAEALDLLPRFVEATIATGRDLGTVFERSQCALLLAFAGQTRNARPHLNAARSALPGAGRAAMAEVSFALGVAAVLVAENDEDSARRVLTVELGTRPLGGGRTRWHRMFPALTYVLVPAARAHWDAEELGPAQAVGRDAARALVALRERADVRPAARLDLSEPGRVRAQLPVPWAVELAVAALAGGSPTARGLLDALDIEPRPLLRRLSSAGSADLRRTARALLAERPAVPAHRLRLHVLGPLELMRDDVLVEHPDLRRERVRQLLQYLAVRGSVSRSAAAADLWPDLLPDAAARNLRVTLTYLRRVLEPGRESEPPSFLHTCGGLLELPTGESLRIDMHEFEAELDAAELAERQAAPSLALTYLTDALARYRGDCLAELTGLDWAELERDRLRVRYVTAAIRAGELLMATGDLRHSLDYAVQALRADAYSEAAYGLLVAVRLERGELDGARHAYRRCLGMLAELDLPPAPRTEMLARRLESHSHQA